MFLPAANVGIDKTSETGSQINAVIITVSSRIYHHQVSFCYHLSHAMRIPPKKTNVFALTFVLADRLRG